MDPLLILLILLILIGTGGGLYIPSHGVLPALVIVLLVMLVLRVNQGRE